jgi:hypothetical protein
MLKESEVTLMSELAEIQSKVDAINAQLTTDIKKKKNTMIITIIGGIILLIVVMIYFSYIKSLIKEVMEPRGLMLYARDQIQKYLPELSKELEKSLKAEAPGVAKASSKKIQEFIPEGRVYLEREFISKTNEALDQFVGEFDKMVSDAIEENRTVIVGFMKDASDSAKKEELIQDIYKSLKAQFDQDYIKADIESYTKVLIRLDQKIKFLYESKDLNEEETIVRDLIYGIRELAQRGVKQKI